jgi:uncharacterized UBP type Zn finger protein
MREQQRGKTMPRCEHYEGLEIPPLPEEIAGCEDCLKTGDSWVHLRMCLGCGHIGCCDSSPNRHAREHHKAHGHPLIRSAEPGETWGYCYVHDVTTRLG